MPAAVKIETDRLILRPPDASDFDRACEMMAHEPSARFVGGVMNRAQCWRAWTCLAGSWIVNGFGMFSMIDKTTGEWVGRTGPWYPAGWPGTEVGWGVHPDHAGKGLAREAAVASMDYAVEALGWTDIMHIIDPDNAPSIALAQRLGSTNRGRTEMPKPFDDAIVDNWGQSADQWRQNRKQFL